MEKNDFQRHPASYRDPSGFVFQNNGKIYRQINQSYADCYELLMESGLYRTLSEQKLLVEHTEIGDPTLRSPGWYKTILPQQIPLVSYPYEWCFDALKQAALLTLQVNRIAIDHGMILKDASAFNIQFLGCEPVFIDSLSFEVYDEASPWKAYRQFCEQFLFPLLIEHYLHLDIQKSFSTSPDGISAHTTAKLLPMRSKLKLSVWLNVLLQDKVQAAKSREIEKQTAGFSKTKMLRLLEHLETATRSLRLKPENHSPWNHYYDQTILSQEYLEKKQTIFLEFLQGINQGTVLDLGCNDGHFSRILAQTSKRVLAVDFDSSCVNRLFQQQQLQDRQSILPLWVDISNPSPAQGFFLEERSSFLHRAKSDLVVALAITHHLVLGKNIPLADVFRQLSALTRNYLIVEFISLEDPKARLLIAGKDQYHLPYDKGSFECELKVYFEIQRSTDLQNGLRTIYRLIKK